MELLPCPFCGSIKVGAIYHGQPATHWSIGCSSCGASGGIIDARITGAGTTDFANARHVIAAWNRRATPAKEGE